MKQDKGVQGYNFFTNPVLNDLLDLDVTSIFMLWETSYLGIMLGKKLYKAVSILKYYCCQKDKREMTVYHHESNPLTLLSLSNSFLSHSKSLYRRLTLDSLTLNTGRFVCKQDSDITRIIESNRRIDAPWPLTLASTIRPPKTTQTHQRRVNR